MNGGRSAKNGILTRSIPSYGARYVISSVVSMIVVYLVLDMTMGSWTGCGIALLSYATTWWLLDQAFGRFEDDVRASARAIVLSPDDHVLLFQVRLEDVLDPREPDVRDIWICPGGGLEKGESFDDGLRRELREELGLADPQIGPWVGTRDVMLDVRGQDERSLERYFVVRARPDEISLEQMAPKERDTIRAIRWWAADELATHGETVRPASLIEFVPELIAGRTPSKARALD